MDFIYVSPKDLPSGANCTFPDTKIVLPTPDEVRLKAAAENGDEANSFRPAPVRYPETGLIVKWGTDVTIGEGQCIWFLRERLNQEVPVPEIYGWKTDAGQTFLYLQLVDGDQLAERWDGLNEEEKSAICRQLRNMCQSWRKIRRSDHHSSPALWRRLLSSFLSFFGQKSDPPIAQLSHIGGQPLRDIIFHDAGQYPAGPFHSTAAFHDWFARLASRTSTNPREEVSELTGLADDVEIVFTHSDLDLSNILISKVGDGPLRVVAIIDWHQSGWYPEPWEWLKAQSVALPGSDWVSDYLSRVLDPPKHEYHLAWEYVSMSTI